VAEGQPWQQHDVHAAAVDGFGNGNQILSQGDSWICLWILQFEFSQCHHQIANWEPASHKPQLATDQSPTHADANV
jgi:hypothetical protein